MTGWARIDPPPGEDGPELELEPMPWDELPRNWRYRSTAELALTLEWRAIDRGNVWDVFTALNVERRKVA